MLEAPQMLALFHQVYAGHEQPPAVASQSKLWEAWLDKTLDPKEVSRANLGRVALELANVCIDGGYSMAPDSVAAAWRRRWEEGLNNRPAEIAAGMDELERLAHAGVLRLTAEGRWDWVSDGLAEHMFSRALRARGWPPGAEQVRSWLGLPATPRLDGALVLVAGQMWRDQGVGLEALAELLAGGARGRDIFGAALAGAAPRVGAGGEQRGVEEFAARLGRLRAWLEEGPGRREQCAGLVGAILWKSSLLLENRWGAGLSLLRMLEAANGAAERLAAAEPENVEMRRSETLSCKRLGHLTAKTAPDTARTWFERGRTGRGGFQRQSGSSERSVGLLR